MKNCIQTCFVLSVLTLTNAHAQNAANSDLSVEGLLWKPSNQLCSSGRVPTSLSHTGGPALVIREGATAYITSPGTYSFNVECCPINNSSIDGDNRIDRLLNSPDRIGFGADTTGGAQADGFTVVTNLNNDGPGSLRDALSQNTPLWITFDPSLSGRTIYLNSGFNIHSEDITIDGSGSDITIAPREDDRFVVFAFRGGNTIVHGITVDGNGTESTGIMAREGSNYWFDHVTVRNFDGDDALSIGQGNRTHTSATNVTVSNYLVENTAFGFQAGGNDEYPDFPLHRTTIHSSILSARDRNPRIQYGGQVHVFNTYVHSNINGGMDAGRNAQIISENNVFSALNALKTNISQTGRRAGAGPTGHVFSSGDRFLDYAGSSGSINPSNVTPFRIPYEYNLKPASVVVEYVLANAGAGRATPTATYCTTVPKTVEYSIQ